MAPITQSQPSRPPSGGTVDSLFGSLNVVGGGSVVSNLGSTLEVVDRGMLVMIQSCCEGKLNGWDSVR